MDAAVPILIMTVEESVNEHLTIRAMTRITAGKIGAVIVFINFSCVSRVTVEIKKECYVTNMILNIHCIVNICYIWMYLIFKPVMANCFPVSHCFTRHFRVFKDVLLHCFSRDYHGDITHVVYDIRKGFPGGLIEYSRSLMMPLPVYLNRPYFIKKNIIFS